MLSGMLCGSRLLGHDGFPSSEVLGRRATEGEIEVLVARHGSIFVKPIFRGGEGWRSKSGLVGRASDLRTTLLAQFWKTFLREGVGARELEITAIKVFLYRRMIGATAEFTITPAAAET